MSGGVVFVHVAAYVLVCYTAHRKHIVGQTQKNTADCLLLTKKVWFLIVEQVRFTGRGFKRLNTEAFLRDSAAN